MALKRSVRAFGIEFPEAYSHISNYSWSTSAGRLDFTVTTYASESARREGADPLQSDNFSCSWTSMNSLNPVKGAYAELRSYDEFADAEDV